MRPLVAVSSCLLGYAVRYDGTDKHQRWLTEVLAGQMDLQALCPEMAIGLGVPRPAIHLREQNGQVRLLGVANQSDDFTLRMQQHAHDVADRLNKVSGYIFKSRSPSCGIDDVELIAANGNSSRYSAGVYSEILQQHFPDLPVIDEIGLQKAVERKRFTGQVFEYAKQLQDQ